MVIPTLLRKAEHEALSCISLSGNVLDLGGDDRADYRKVLKGNPTFTTVNLDEKARPDIFHDLEQPLPLKNSSYDHAVLINVLEHIYDYRQLLSEALRVVRPGGTIVIVVPFLFPVHPSPRDFWRFSKETLERECVAVGLNVQQVVPLGTGVFAAQFIMIDRLMPLFIRLLGYLLRPLVSLADSAFTKLARLLGKKYDPADYALGYLVTAEKPSR